MYTELLELLEALQGVSQDPVYHPEGDALFHSLQVYQLAAEDHAEPELLAAALLHDVGKASAGRDHDVVGAELLVGLPSRTRWCVAHHLDLLRDPKRTRARLYGTTQLADLEKLRRWDVGGRDPDASVCSVEQALSHVLEALDEQESPPTRVPELIEDVPVERSSRNSRRPSRFRGAIAIEAARLMYFEGVSQYFDAKRVASRRVVGSQWRSLQFRPGDLPSNGEIRAALLQLASLAEGEDRSRRLAAMRIVAFEVMNALERYHPRLIGSVWSGHARRGSDIDLHVFTESLEALELDLWGRGWAFEAEKVLIRVGSDFRTFHHLHLHDRPFPVELSVYGLAERRISTRSSVDGQPIDRVSTARVLGLLEQEHAEAWRDWQRTGELDWEEVEGVGAFDSLVSGPEG